MAITVLKNCKLYLTTVDLSGVANELGLTYEAPVLDATTFGSDGAQVKVAGIPSFAADLKGFAEYGLNLADEQLFADVGAAEKVLTILSTATEGDRGFFGKALAATYAPGAKVGDLQAFSASVQGSGLLVRGNSLVVGEKTASGNGTAFNLGAVGASQSLYGVLHVVAFSGLTSIAVKIQSATAQAFTTPTDRITFATSTGLDTQWATPVAGPITDTWWRAIWTVVGTGSATIAVAMGIQ